MKALLLAVLLLIGCGTDRQIDGKICGTTGLFNEDEKCAGVRYCTVVGNVVWAVILFETVAAPIYFFGWSMREPCSDQGISR